MNDITYNMLFISKGFFFNNRMPGLLWFLKKCNQVLSYIKDFVKAYRLNQSILGMHNTYSYHGTFGQWGKMVLVVSLETVRARLHGLVG